MPPRKRITRPVYDKIVALRKAGESARAISARVKLSKSTVDTILSGGYEAIEPWAKGVDALLAEEKAAGDAAQRQAFGLASAELASRELQITVDDAKAYAAFRNRQIAAWRDIVGKRTEAIRGAGAKFDVALSKIGQALDAMPVESIQTIDDLEALMRIITMFHDVVSKNAKLAQLVMGGDAPKEDQPASMAQTPGDARAFLGAMVERYRKVLGRSPMAADVEVVG